MQLHVYINYFMNIDQIIKVYCLLSIYMHIFLFFYANTIILNEIAITFQVLPHWVSKQT